jgi:hypothetical protein
VISILIELTRLIDICFSVSTVRVRAYMALFSSKKLAHKLSQHLLKRVLKISPANDFQSKNNFLTWHNKTGISTRAGQIFPNIFHMFSSRANNWAVYCTMKTFNHSINWSPPFETRRLPGWFGRTVQGLRKMFLTRIPVGYQDETGYHNGVQNPAPSVFETHDHKTDSALQD